MKDKYVNPYTDFGFKRIFGQEANKDILISFLNSILPPQHQIAELDFLNTEQIPPRKDVYRSILDLHCVTPSGERFIVEMQQKLQPFFMDRSVYYTASAITNMVKRGDDAIKLPAVYFIGILNFVHTEAGWQDLLVREITLKDRDGVEVYKKLRMIFIQTPLFTKTENELMTTRDKWFYFLQKLPALESIPAAFGMDPVFVRAFEVAETANMSEAEQLAYFKSWDDMVTLKAIIDYDKKVAREEGLAEGREEGREKGKEEGLAEGMEKGLVKGKAEGLAEGIEIGRVKNNRLNALKMKAEGCPMSLITTVTGLTEADL